MSRAFIFACTLLAGICLCILPQSLSAQTTFDRISAVERSDGKGFVVRHHLSEMVDSFKVSQPAPDLIQMMLYSQEFDTTNFRLPPRTETFEKVDVIKTGNGIGIEIQLGLGHYFKTSVYPDQNGRHLLLALERIPFTQLERIVEKAVALDLSAPSDNGQEVFAELDGDNSFLRLRESSGFNVIVLDAGHGGHDPGTTNRQLGLTEKDIALTVTLKVGEYLERYLPEVEVVYTRTEDKYVTRAERGLIATRNKADLFVSIHVNSAGNATSAHGTETFFLGLARSQSALEVMKRENSVFDPESGYAPNLSEEELVIYELTNAGNMAISERVASMIEDQFKNRASRRSRGVKQAGLEVLWHASTPAVLVELGFLSNPTEARFLNSEYGQTIMASAIFRAIRDFKMEYDRSLRNNNGSRASNER
jgi:N-acetylmuramoyl-L-alanine amidase